VRLRAERRQEELLLGGVMNERGEASSVFAEFAAPLRAFIARRASPGLEVDDVLQNVFLRIHQKLPELRDHQRIDAWIFQITRNALADAKRARAREAWDELDESAHPAPGEEGADPSQAFARCIAPMIEQLDEPYREAILLTEIEGLTHAEAAKRARVSHAAMKSRALRGREQLRSIVLQCCRVELDARGHIFDFERRVSSCCDDGVQCSQAPNPEEKQR